MKKLIQLYLFLFIGICDVFSQKLFQIVNGRIEGIKCMGEFEKPEIYFLNENKKEVKTICIIDIDCKFKIESNDQIIFEAGKTYSLSIKGKYVKDTIIEELYIDNNGYLSKAIKIKFDELFTLIFVDEMGNPLQEIVSIIYGDTTAFKNIDKNIYIYNGFSNNLPQDLLFVTNKYVKSISAKILKLDTQNYIKMIPSYKSAEIRRDKNLIDESEVSAFSTSPFNDTIKLLPFEKLQADDINLNARYQFTKSKNDKRFYDLKLNNIFTRKVNYNIYEYKDDRRIPYKILTVDKRSFKRSWQFKILGPAVLTFGLVSGVAEIISGRYRKKYINSLNYIDKVKNENIGLTLRRTAIISAAAAVATSTIGYSLFEAFPKLGIKLKIK